MVIPKRCRVCFFAFTVLVCLISSPTRAQPASSLANRWKLRGPDGGITWDIAGDFGRPHQDHVEMSGLRVSVVAHHGVDGAGKLVWSRVIVWPMLRTIPNDTHASLIREFPLSDSARLRIDGQDAAEERPIRATFDGLLTYESTAGDSLRVQRTLFPSIDQPAVIERLLVSNSGPRSVDVELDFPARVETTDAAKGVYGVYLLESRLEGVAKSKLAPGQRLACALIFSGRKQGEPALSLDAASEELKRRAKISQLRGLLRLTTPNPVLNEMFQLAKLRAAESIYATKGGLMHGPGGTRYYAAIWANDQAEYANPFFAYLGDSNGVQSAITSFRQFAHYTNSAFKPIPSSIIAEGGDCWHAAGDRGDMAMIAYGAARFALTRGNRSAAEELQPLIEWCLTYLERKQTPEGVIFSDSDEMEGRLPTGKANLNTACLTCDALNSAAMLVRSLGQAPELEARFKGRARALRSAINRYFGATVEGFETYRYYDGDERLRGWIAMPLCMGIDERKAGTVAALTSPRLWTPDGVATISGQPEFWDRETLYALRGAFAVGEPEVALAFLQRYSERRLLGEHVPYAFEYGPGGDLRHLSAESALYGRIFTEGLLGYRPTGLWSFQLTPRLPAGWEKVTLENIHAHGHVFDLEARRVGADGQEVVVKLADSAKIIQRRLAIGEAADVQLPRQGEDGAFPPR